MPKSRQLYNFTYKPSYQLSDQQQRQQSGSAGPGSRNSNNSSNSSTSAHASSGTTSVKDLLTHLRLTQPATIPDGREEVRGNDATAAAPASSLAPAPTVHPSLQSILGIAETLPPRPRARGFAAPNSWRHRNGLDPFGRPVNDGESTTTSSASGFETRGGSTYPNFEVGSTFDLQNIPGFDGNASSSLVNLCLRSIARNWPFHIVYDRYFLRELRPVYKSLLLAHLAAYTLSRRQQYVDEEEILLSSIDKSSLELLFRSPFPEEEYDRDAAESEQVDESLGISGTEHITHLNFAGAIGYSISLKDLLKVFTRKIPATTIPSEATPSKAVQKQVIPDNWEDLADEDEESTQITDPSNPDIRIRHFANLTHISLAYPNFDVSFPDLLKLTSEGIPTITHLSLAGWPTPTAGASSLSIQARAGINLKHLSKNLICLRFLDVSDCDTDMYAGLHDVDWTECWKGVDEVVARQGQALSARGIKVLALRNNAITELEAKVKQIRRSCRADLCRFVYSKREQIEIEEL